MRLYILSTLIIIFFTSCASKHEPLNSVTKVVLDKYINSLDKRVASNRI